MTLVLPIDTAVHAFRPDPISDAEAAAMFRAVVNLFGRWELTDEQAATLLDMPVRTYRRWKAGEQGRIDRDAKARLSNLMGVHKALRIIFREPQRGYGWIKASNQAFEGRSALEIMLGGELTDLMRVRRFLDAERSAW
ncbi:MbcA/ParS/Xre antitoxin family protein [Phenylobacterium sp.]|uniref:MbcA/ParS/Xre antitoxin family protein n=1 Tax=Phenylobacterium sp. TaxID=1871053 RepID=UPI002731FB4E|nr:MbcA/ParS/Xre antitoxin family protein [Phenylobacterium sp.]MDP1601075.1 MbcA/ParS/Xre antitoxin family protein [Phenylobacterium sp.]MDP3593777.1 MbcA/ParS/Xre antitoxin family protein [Phenylobacterium sp.]